MIEHNGPNGHNALVGLYKLAVTVPVMMHHQARGPAGSQAGRQAGVDEPARAATEDRELVNIMQDENQSMHAHRDANKLSL